MRFPILLLIVCVAGPSTTEAQSLTSDSATRVRVLFLGNSYTHFNEYPRLFQNLAISAGVTSLPENSHPTSLGSYLAACVLFAFIYGQSPVGLSPYTYTTTYHSATSWDTATWRIEDSVARLIQETAWEAVRQHSKR